MQSRWIRWASTLVGMGLTLGACGDDTGASASGAGGDAGGGDPASSGSVASTAQGTGGASGAGGAPNGGVGGGGGAGGAPTELTFGPCEAGYVGECARLEVPLDHAQPGGEVIDLHLARLRSDGPSTRQLWLLSGGPGQGGHVFESIVPFLASSLPGTDVYVVDHRGTGYSHRLTCSAQDAPDSYGGYILAPEDVPACLAELDEQGDLERLAFFTTSQASQDVLAAIRATRQGDSQVFVYGASYGTHWAHRVLQLGANEVDGFIFDGFMTPEKFAFTQYDRGVDEVGAILAEGCANDASCSSRLGTDPVERARRLWEALDERPCGSYDGQLGRTIASLFADQTLTAKAFLFPFIHRLERCEPADVVAIDTLVDRFFDSFAGGPPEPPLNSGVLQYNIVLSELWNVPGLPEPTAADLEASAAAQVFLVDSSYPASIAPLRAVWPLPPDDYSDLALPVVTDKPLLWLSGGLDSRTPPTQSRLITSVYDAPTQPLVQLPSAVHTPVWSSPLLADPSSFCGLSLMSSFLDGAVDDSCIDGLFPISYEAPSDDVAVSWWGTADDWGDGDRIQPRVWRPASPVRAMLEGPPTVGTARAIAQLRRALGR